MSFTSRELFNIYMHVKELNEEHHYPTAIDEDESDPDIVSLLFSLIIL